MANNKKSKSPSAASGKPVKKKAMERVDRMWDESNRLTQETTELRTAVERVDADLASLRTLAEQAAEQAQSAFERASSQSLTARSLDSQAQVIERELKDAKRSNRKLSERLEAEEDRTRSLREQSGNLAPVVEQVQRLEEGIAALRRRVEVSERQAEQSRASATQGAERFRDLDRNLQEARDMVKGLGNKVALLAARLEALDRHDDQSSRLEPLRQEIARLTERIATLEEREDPLEVLRLENAATQEQTQNEVRGLGARIDALERREDPRAPLQSELATIQERTRAVIQDLVERVAALEERADPLDVLRPDIAAERQRLRAEARDLADRLEALADRQAQGATETGRKFDRIAGYLRQLAAKLSDQATRQRELDQRVAALASSAAEVKGIDQRIDGVAAESKTGLERADAVQSRTRSLTWGGLVLLLLLGVGWIASILLMQHKIDAYQELNDVQLKAVIQPIRQARNAEGPGLTQDLEGLSGAIRNVSQVLTSGIAVTLQQAGTLEVPATPVAASPRPAPVAAPTGMEQQIAGLQAQQNDIVSEIGQVSASLRRVETRLPVPPPATGAGSRANDAAVDWKTAQRQHLYTIQLLGSWNRAPLLRFAQDHGLLTRSAYLLTEHQGRPWYVLFLGIYRDLEEARRALDGLPNGLTRWGAWIRRIPAETATVKPLA